MLTAHKAAQAASTAVVLWVAEVLQAQCSRVHLARNATAPMKTPKAMHAAAPAVVL
jgi:hypothetical protein